MMRYIPMILIATLLGACDSGKSEKKHRINSKKNDKIGSELGKSQSDSAAAVISPTSKRTVKANKSTYSYQILFSPDLGWGYDILENNAVKIHQPHIPVIQGMKGFRSADDAAKVAEKVIEKLEKGLMPPSLTLEEMQQLSVL